MKIKFTLSNPGGEIDSKTIDIEDEEYVGEEITDAAEDFLGDVADWNVGDSFTITEV